MIAQFFAHEKALGSAATDSEGNPCTASQPDKGFSVTIAHLTDNEQNIAYGWAPGPSLLGDLLTDVKLDLLAAAGPECMADLLVFADRVIEVA